MTDEGEDYRHNLARASSRLQGARDDLREAEGKFLELSGWEEISEAGMWRHPEFSDPGEDPHFKRSNPVFAQKTALAVAEAFYAAGRRTGKKPEEPAKATNAEASLSLTDESLVCAECGNEMPPGMTKIAIDAQRFRHALGSPLCRRAAVSPAPEEPTAVQPAGEQAARIANVRSLLSYALDEAARLGVEVRFSFTTVGGQKAWYLIKGVEGFYFGEIQ